MADKYHSLFFRKGYIKIYVAYSDAAAIKLRIITFGVMDHEVVQPLDGTPGTVSSEEDYP